MLITNHFAAINLIHTGFIQKLADKYSVQILSDFIQEADIVKINRYFEIQLTLVSISFGKEPPVLRLLRLFEKFLFFNLFKANTHRVKLLEQSIFIRRVVHGLGWLIGSGMLARWLLNFVRKAIILLSSRIAQPGLPNPGLAGVISSSPLDSRENAIVNRLARQKVPALAIIISWDNLTSKGMINANHDYVLVWNEVMKCEFENFYSGFQPIPRICVTGVPRFDVYVKRKPNEISLLNFKRKLSISGSADIILFATSAPRHFPNQRHIVEDLLEYCKRRLNTILLIRLHPADQLAYYKEYLSERTVRVCRSSACTSLPELNFLDLLTDTIYSCTVCVQVASTMRLDAAACGKPVVNIGYDGNEELPYSQSVRRLYDYSHQLPLNAFKVGKLVLSKQELFDHLDQVLRKRSQSAFTQAALSAHAPIQAGGSVSRMMRYVDEWLA
ncbi:CDP-glycerol glycerophosphotransferase family protein [Dyadobacter sp. Leaf189]|uniref:CDP-glycerol glycerophosphotransferase family protein n=1 Tax=Dyadobacter sp. Leaf189 TaxID=1736295 RepID=UPI00138F9B92|nr:CDP-glycerol glycerophosphotransferase family protein [Dyadobacter sp. Leaf189]